MATQLHLPGCVAKNTDINIDIFLSLWPCIYNVVAFQVYMFHVIPCIHLTPCIAATVPTSWWQVHARLATALRRPRNGPGHSTREPRFAWSVNRQPWTENAAPVASATEWWTSWLDGPPSTYLTARENGPWPWNTSPAPATVTRTPMMTPQTEMDPQKTSSLFRHRGNNVLKPTTIIRLDLIICHQMALSYLKGDKSARISHLPIIPVCRKYWQNECYTTWCLWAL